MKLIELHKYLSKMIKIYPELKNIDTCVMIHDYEESLGGHIVPIIQTGIFQSPDSKNMLFFEIPNQHYLLKKMMKVKNEH